jgi:mycoredoxin
MSEITMYGAEWCGDCIRSKRLLSDLGVEYTYINIEEVAGAADKVVEINGGTQSIPVITFPDLTHLTEPSDPDLRKKLESLGLI